jgi:hypothetical protein
MSLNHIKLNTRLLTDLYPDVLIQSTSTTTVPDYQPIKYLGKNAKHIALLINNPSLPYLPDNELSFLTSILSACKLSLADVAIVNLHSISINKMEESLHSLDANIFILFGMDPLSIDLPINFPQFQLQGFNGKTYLFSPTLQELEMDKALKLKLWNCLKTLFGI